MAIVFPASPSVNETFTAGSITYKWDGDKWIGLGVTPADRLIEGSNSLELDANNDLVYTAPGTLKVNSADVSGYIAEFNQTNTSNSGQILINSPTDGNSRPSLMDFARGGNVKFSVGMGYNDGNNGFLISAGGSLASGISNAVFRITPDGKTGIGNYAANGTQTPTSLLEVATNWDNGDVPMVHFVGANNEAPQSGTQNISFQISDENSNVLHKVWNTGGGNSDFGNVYYAGRFGINNNMSSVSTNAALTVANSVSSSATRINLVNTGSSSDESTQIYSQNDDLALFAGGDSTQELRLYSNGNIEAKSGSILGKFYSSNTTTLELTDWTSSVGWRVLEVFGKSNPNNLGSNYMDPIHVYLYHGYGWNGSALTSYLYLQDQAPFARSVYTSGSGGSANQLSVAWYNGSTAVSGTTGVAAGSGSYYPRLTTAQASTNSQFNVRVIRRY